MSFTYQPFFAASLNLGNLKLTNANGTTVETVATGSTNGTKIEGMVVSQNSTSALSAQLWITVSSVAYLLCTVTIPANAGNTAGTPPVNMLTSANCPGLPLDANGNPYLYLANSATLGIGLLVAVTSSDFLFASSFGGNY